MFRLMPTIEDREVMIPMMVASPAIGHIVPPTDTVMIAELTSETVRNVSQGIQITIDSLGIKSGIAQQLNSPITSVEKLVASPDQVLLIFQPLSGDTNPVGYLKYGTKNLYFYKKDGSIVERRDVPCLLDFYIEDTLQRQGFGLQLFEKMLSLLSLSSVDLAYDRPSPKLLSFLRRHFNLQSPDHQPNRYVIYPTEGFSL